MSIIELAFWIAVFLIALPFVIWLVVMAIMLVCMLAHAAYKGMFGGKE